MHHAEQFLRLSKSSRIQHFAAETMKKDIYADDFITGASDLENAFELQKELISIFKSAIFHFRKWASNSEKLLFSSFIE